MRTVSLDGPTAWEYEQQQYQAYLAQEASAEGIINKIRGDPDYVKFLLIEYPRIRAALDVQALTLDEEEQIARYPSSVGSALHLDLVILDEWLANLSPQEKRCLWAWISRQERPPAVGTRFIGGYRDNSVLNTSRSAGALIATLREQLNIPRPEEVRTEGTTES